MSRRGATSLVGILPLDKPAGLTSHDVVARVRRSTGEGRVGHAGTLDPMATGLLVVLIGAYARLAPYLTSASKCYEATIAFGAETDTDDAEGAVTRRAAVPAELLDPGHARVVLSGFLGSSMQTPPAYSAIKVGGRTAHREARAGSAMELEPRPVEVLAAELLATDADAASWNVAFDVSKGTYIRALARDIGRACGSAAHLSALRRTTSGRLTLADSHTLEEM
ncbi:MAG TPA: tRNA pseudouridine(55) synthase TruB, partial [Coriobacteriia bacterium]